MRCGVIMKFKVFKVGDLVIVKQNVSCNSVFKNRSLKIISADHKHTFPYTVMVDGHYDVFFEPDLQLIKTKNCPKYLKKYEI